MKNLVERLKRHRTGYGAAYAAIDTLIAEIEGEEKAALADQEASRAINDAIRRAIDEAPFADQVEVNEQLR